MRSRENFFSELRSLYTPQSIDDLGAQDHARFIKHVTKAAGIRYHYGYQPFTQETLQSLLAFAKDCDTEAAITALASGRIVNSTENRPALHMQTRANLLESTEFPFHSTLKKFSDSNRYSDIVHIGIGGSFLGVKMVIEALSQTNPLQKIHFLSSIDGHAFDAFRRNVDPLRTAVIVASKTFTTVETLANMALVCEWMNDAGGAQVFFENAAAVTANPEEAARCGFKKEHIHDFDIGIGGRFSLWSAVGMTIALATGEEQFRLLCQGAADMDAHFIQTPVEDNMPVLMALMNIFSRMAVGAPARAVIPYDRRLSFFPSYLQQLIMESNGKNRGKAGGKLPYPTAPVVYGDTGTDAQHSFFQLLHESFDPVAIDFIGTLSPGHNHENAHILLQANMAGQIEAFSRMPGRAMNILQLDRLDAQTLGALIALYEHATYIEGVLWDINSFDQPGVELGKRLSAPIARAILEKNGDNLKKETFFILEKK